MAKSALHSGWRRDESTNTLDIVVGGKDITKYGPLDSENTLGVINLYADSTTALYDLGTRLQVDERVFRYARAGSALTRYNPAMNFDSWSLTNEASNQSVAVGDTSVQVVNTSATADLYKGGWIVIYTTPAMQVRHIIGNDASDGTDTKLYIDGPIEAAGTTPWITGYPSIYYNTKTHAENYNTVVCVPVCTVAASSYYWGQTWGPCCGRAAGTVPGESAHDRELYFAGTGALYGHIQAEGATAGGYQRAGYLLPKTTSSGGDQLYMLQLTP